MSAKTFGERRFLRLRRHCCFGERGTRVCDHLMIDDEAVRQYSVPTLETRPALFALRSSCEKQAAPRTLCLECNGGKRLPIQNKGKLLAEPAVAMPTKAAECSAKILEGDKDGLGVLSWRDHARAFFRHYLFR